LRLKFQNKYLSIEPFNAMDLPNFTVLTGVNGSGKSHLLQAIIKGDVIIEGVNHANVVLFNYENFRLDNEPQFNAHQLAAEREAAWQYHEQQIKPNITSYRQGVPNYEPLKAECEANKKSFLSRVASEASDYSRNFKNFFSGTNIRQNPQAQGIFSLAQNVPYSIDEIDHDKFVSLYKPYVLKNNFLPHQLGKIFWDYYVKFRTNQVNAFENEKNGKNYPAISESDFIALHGEKPWDLINRILEKFNSLQYKVNSPEGTDIFANFKLMLTHVEKGVEIDFSALSSGEKILMALVASVYKSTGDKSFPDVLLLDEVDASLHPSMMKNMLDVIKDIFLDHGVTVILVTHSPTTIALAPEEAIYVVNRSGKNRIEKKSKQEALSILTQGFATLEEGLRLFDEVAKSKITLISEGKNTLLLSKALEINGINDVYILAGVEEMSGKNQLKTLFDFFSKTIHTNKVLFVWDCDAKYSFAASNNTYPFILPKIASNTVTQKGIENMFPSDLFVNFVKTIQMSTGKAMVEFDDTRKRDFENFILERNDAADFVNFSSLVAEIAKIREEPTARKEDRSATAA